MDLFGKKRFRRDEVEQKIADFEIELSMTHHGWTFWPANASEQQKKAAIERYIETGEHRWYAPGEREDPVIIEGKLVVRPDSVVERPSREGHRRRWR